MTILQQKVCRQNKRNIFRKVCSAVDRFLYYKPIVLFFGACSLGGILWVLFHHDIFHNNISGYGYEHPIFFAWWGINSALFGFYGLKTIWRGVVSWEVSYEKSKGYKLFRVFMCINAVTCICIVLATLIYGESDWRGKVHIVTAGLWGMGMCVNLVVFFIVNIHHSILYRICLVVLFAGIVSCVVMVLSTWTIVALHQFLAIIPCLTFLICCVVGSGHSRG
ncbi:MAG: hypothetical protein FWF56_06690 [Firmicutes bacterium]|nr:hypothetical protein [Bacillota bacterium]